MFLFVAGSNATPEVIMMKLATSIVRKILNMLPFNVLPFVSFRALFGAF